MFDIGKVLEGQIKGALRDRPVVLFIEPEDSRILEAVFGLPEERRLAPDAESAGCLVATAAGFGIMADAHVIGLNSLGIKVLDKVEVPTDAVTFGPLVVKALEQKPDGIIFGCKAEKIAKIIKELKSRGWTKMDQLLVFSSGVAPELYSAGDPKKLKAERKLIANYLQNIKGFRGIMFDLYPVRHATLKPCTDC